MLAKLWARVTNINVPLIAAALFASAILHILATFATPLLTPTSAYDRLASALPLNTMQVLPEIAPGSQPLPFLSPDARYAMCRFDTKDGAVTLSAVLPEPGWTLQLYSPKGEAFFTSVGTPQRPTDVSLRIVPGHDAWQLGARPTGFATGLMGRRTATVAVAQEATLTIPANEGIAVLRAPDRGESYRNRSAADLSRAVCAAHKDAPAT